MRDLAAKTDPPVIRTLTIRDAEFLELRDRIYRSAGIFLSETKKALVVGRLARRLRELGLASFEEYVRFLRDGADPQEATRLIEAICTHETHFFREPRQFEYLETRLVPEWERAAAAGSRPRFVRVWSAGCATGEEPYSIAMSLLARLGHDRGWRVEVLATDLSTRVLEQAREGVWPVSKSTEMPAPYLRAYMMKGLRSEDGYMKAKPLLRSVVRFARHNLSDSADGLQGTFDAIFCRNVLIYFDAESRSRAIHRLISRLAPAGRLFLGHSESLNGITNRLCSVGPTVYGWPSGAPDREWPALHSARPRTVR
jgi:chemotaxis protein methyltransferase CheR